MPEASSITVSCRNVWKVYGPKADRIVDSPDALLPRAELLEKTGCVAAVRDVSFDVAPGEVFVVMGSSLQVQPAASFPLTAKRNGAVLAIINREPGPLDEVADFAAPLHHGTGA